ncbi:MAG: uracil phosphoribosyltransferase [Cyclobacteriaceae bacterium]|nr:uracil phosphoribosyltransferase [Cyclobacteriaceae bacterium]
MTTINLSQCNSIASVYLAGLRDKSVQKDRLKFRYNLKRLGQIMAYEISKKFTYTSKKVETPLGTSPVSILEDQPVIIAIMRAALPFYDGVLSVFDEADSGFVGAYRTVDFQTSKSIRTEYIASGSLADKTVVLVDPMLATGKSMLDAIHKLEAYGKPKKWIILSVIAAPEGVAYLDDHCGDNVTLWCGAIDERLNDKFYIVPGLGDAGDLAFGEKI